MFRGDDDEQQNARERMAEDRSDPRRAFVWGVLAVSYKLDPGYLPKYATKTLTEGYGLDTKEQLLAMNRFALPANEHSAYNQFRLCLLARAGQGAGLLDAETSWERAIQEASVVQHHYDGWLAYGRGYLAGHLAYRREMGDGPEELMRLMESIGSSLPAKQANVWANIPWGTRMF
jgi:hypothetical protein